MDEEKDFYTLEELWQMLFLREGESLEEYGHRLIHTACERSRRIIRHLPAGENPNPYKWNLKCFTPAMHRWHFEKAYLLYARHCLSKFIVRGGKREDFQPDLELHPDNIERIRYKIY